VAETIKEFLVSIGYKVDGSSERRFEDSLKKATLRAELLGRAIAEAAEAIARGAVRIAQGFDDIYYASQRTKASVENLKSLSYAVSQLGGSYSGAMQSFEAFGTKLRNNPGYGSMVRQLGVATEANGKARDTAIVMTELAQKLSRMPRHVSMAYLEALGIDERTFDALKSGDLVRYTEEYRKKQVQLGVDQKRTAEIGRDLTVAWRQMSLTLSVLGEKLLQSVGPGLTKLIEKFDQFVTNNGPAIERFFEKLVDALGEVLKAIMQLVEKGEGPIVEFFDKFSKNLDTLTLALTAFAAFLVGTWLVRVLGAFSAVSTGFAAMLLTLGITPAMLAAGLLVGSTSPANGGEDAEIARRRANGTWGSTPTESGTGGAPARPAAPPQITDKRNWWQRKMPKMLGGQDDPNQAAKIQSGALLRRGGGARRSKLSAEESAEMARGIRQTAADLGVPPEAIATAISYETGGTMDKWQRGPTTKWGQHRGLIQWGEPQARKYGVTADSSITDQMKAVTRYLKDAGVKPGHGLMEVYSAINAGGVGRNNRSDAAAGGAPGTVADKVNGMQRPHGGALGRLEKMGGVASPAGEPSAAAATPASTPEAGYSRSRKTGQDSYGANQSYGASGLQRDAGEGGPQLPPLARMQAAQDAANRAGGATGSTGPAPLTPGGSSTSTTVGMTQNTAINVTGGSDPTGTGNAVADRQREVNAMLMRQLKENVR
jgi:hypothetical protein